MNRGGTCRRRNRRRLSRGSGGNPGRATAGDSDPPGRPGPSCRPYSSWENPLIFPIRSLGALWKKRLNTKGFFILSFLLQTVCLGEIKPFPFPMFGPWEGQPIRLKSTSHSRQKVTCLWELSQTNNSNFLFESSKSNCYNQAPQLWGTFNFILNLTKGEVRKASDCFLSRSILVLNAKLPQKPPGLLSTSAYNSISRICSLHKPRFIMFSVKHGDDAWRWQQNSFVHPMLRNCLFWTSSWAPYAAKYYIVVQFGLVFLLWGWWRGRWVWGGWHQFILLDLRFDQRSCWEILIETISPSTPALMAW